MQTERKATEAGLVKEWGKALSILETKRAKRSREEGLSDCAK